MYVYVSTGSMAGRNVVPDFDFGPPSVFRVSPLVPVHQSIVYTQYYDLHNKFVQC